MIVTPNSKLFVKVCILVDYSYKNHMYIIWTNPRAVRKSRSCWPRYHSTTSQYFGYFKTLFLRNTCVTSHDSSPEKYQYFGTEGWFWSTKICCRRYGYFSIDLISCPLSLLLLSVPGSLQHQPSSGRGRRQAPGAHCILGWRVRLQHGMHEEGRGPGGRGGGGGGRHASLWACCHTGTVPVQSRYDTGGWRQFAEGVKCTCQRFG